MFFRGRFLHSSQHIRMYYPHWYILKIDFFRLYSFICFLVLQCIYSYVVNQLSTNWGNSFLVKARFKGERMGEVYAARIQPKWKLLRTPLLLSFRSRGDNSKVKVKYLRGAFWRSWSLKWPDFPCPWSWAYWHYAAELCTLSFTYPLCDLALTNTTDNTSEMCPLKLTDFCLFLYLWSYTILQGLLIPPMALTSCQDQGSNLLPPDERDVNYRVTSRTVEHICSNN